VTVPPSDPTGPAYPYNPPPLPRAKSRKGWIIGGVIAAVVLLVLCCSVGGFVVKKAMHQPNPIPSLTTERKAVYDFAVTSLANVSKSGKTAGFPLAKLSYKYLFLGQSATCKDASLGDVSLGGSSGLYPVYWCASDDILYFDESGLTAEKAKSDDTAFSYILNSYAFAQADAKPGYTAERKFCTVGAVAKQETNAGRLTLVRSTAIRDFLTESQTQSDAFTAGYNSGKASGCSTY
jgi:hypothetical protein